MKVVDKIEEYAIVLLMILASKTVFFGLINAKMTYLSLLAVVLLVCIVRGKLKRVNKYNATVVFALAALSVIQVLLNGTMVTTSYINSMVVSYLPFVICFFVAEVMDAQSYMEKYTNIMVAICIVSLVCFTIAVSQPMIAWAISKSVEFNDHIYNISWFYTWGWSVHVFSRNSGPFWEPGGFQGFILMALLMVLFKREHKWAKVKIVIYILTILTTGSTTGYILLGIIIVLFYQKVELAFVADGSKKNKNLLKIALFAVAILAVIYIVTSGNISDKFSGTNESASVRVNDLLSSVSLVADRPLFGYGFSSERINRTKVLGVVNDSVGMWSLLYTCGIPFGLFYLCRQIKGLKRIFESSQIETIVIAAVFIVIHFTEAVWWLPAYVIFLFYLKQPVNREGVNT